MLPPEAITFLAHFFHAASFKFYTPHSPLRSEAHDERCGFNAGYIQIWMQSDAHLFDIAFSTVAITLAKPVDIGGIYGRFKTAVARKSLAMDAGGNSGRRAFELRTRNRLQGRY
jgi:hypothetical protein